MRKEEILEMSRKENQNKDLVEVQIENKAAKYGGLAMLLLASVYYVVDIFMGRGQNVGFYSLISIYCSIIYGYKAIKLENKRQFYAITSIIWTVLTVMLLLEYFKVI